MKRVLNCLMLLLVSCVLLMGNSEQVQAQNTIGGHFGVVQPILTISDGDVTTLADAYAIGFPIGITIKKNDTWAFDAEFVPFVKEGDVVDFLVHPGVLRALGNSFTFGFRAAFEVKANVYGFTPLINKSFPLNENMVWFVEGVLPVRFGSNTSITAGIHVGVGF